MPIIIKNRRIFFLLSVFFLIIGLMLFYFRAVPRIINLEKHRPEIEAAIRENIAAPVKIGNMQTEMTWDLGIKLYTDSLNIKHKDGSEFISSDFASIEISLPSLLSKKVIIRNIEADNLKADIVRLKNGEFNIQELIPKKTAKPKKYTFIFKNSSITANKYYIKYTDRYIQPESSFILKGDELKITDFDPKKFIRVQANGYILSEFKPDTYFTINYSSKLPIIKGSLLKNDITAKGNIQNLYPGMFTAYLNSYTSYKYCSITGASSFDFDVNLVDTPFNPNNFMLKGVVKGLKAIKPCKGNVLSFNDVSYVQLKGNLENNDLNIENFGVSGKDTKISIKGKIKNFRSKKRTLNLRLLVNNSSVSTIANIFPKEIRVPLDPFRKILKYNIDGRVWANVLIVGIPKKPDLFGNLKFNNLYILDRDPKIPAGFGKIQFLDGTLSLDIDAFTDPKGHVKITGIVSPVKNKTLDLKINSNTTDLKRSLRLLLAVHDIFKFKLGPVENIKGEGKGQITLAIRGKFKFPDLTGVLNIYNASGSYDTLYGTVNNIKGKLLFKGDKVYYNGITGSINGSKAIAEGYSTLKGYSDVKLSFINADMALAHDIIFKSPLLIKTKEVLEDIERSSGIADVILYLKGTEDTLLAKGDLDFKWVNIKYFGYSEPFNNLKGNLKFNDETLIFNNLKGDVINSRVTVNGDIVGTDKINMTLTSPSIDLKQGRKFIIDSPALVASSVALRDFNSITGNAAGRIVLQGDIQSKQFFQEAEFSNPNVTLTHRNLGFPVKINSGSILITSNGVFSKGIEAVALNTPLSIAGQVTGFAASAANVANGQPVDMSKLVPDFNIAIPKFNLSKAKELARSPVFNQQARVSLSQFKELKGEVGANINVRPKTYRAELKFNDTSATYADKEIPLEISTGKLIFSDNYVELEDFYSKISRSSAYISGFIRNYNKNPVLDLLISARLNSKDVDKYITPLINEPVTAKGDLPLTAIVSGRLDNWDLLAQMTLGKGDILSFQSDMFLPENKIRVLSLRAEGTKDNINIKNLEVAVDSDPLTVATSASARADFETDLNRLLVARGGIDKIRSEDPIFNRLYISTPNPFDIKLINPAIKTDTGQPLFSGGEFKGNILLNGRVSSPRLIGSAVLSNVEVPSRNILIEYANTDFNQNQININDSSIKIADSVLKIKASLANILDRPVLIKNLEIYSPYIDIDKLSDTLRQQVSDNTIETQTPPFTIENGVFRADELVISNLITGNVASNFDLTADWLLTMSNLSFNAAGGAATGEIIYNLKSTELDVGLNARNLQANAAATTLLRLPNEVYGTLNGEAQFHTRGTNSQELIANSNGTASFTILNGRLVRLGSIEYLLRAVNVVQSGIAGLNFNNILDLVAPQRTGYFDILEGNVTAADGILKTDNITSIGRNLSLYLSGDLDMVTNNADITILGRLSKKVSGLLGPLGSLSINTFIGFIPGLGFLPSQPEVGIIDLIPGLGRIPGLGLGGGKYRRFAVKIDGNLYDPTSVKSFRWLD